MNSKSFGFWTDKTGNLQTLPWALKSNFHNCPRIKAVSSYQYLTVAQDMLNHSLKILCAMSDLL